MQWSGAGGESTLPSSAPVVKAVAVICQVPGVSLLCELPQSMLVATNICSGHNMVKFTQAAAVTEI